MVHVAVIGAYGSAGAAVAAELAETASIDQLTLIDDGEPGGGLCILRGCMPSKEVLSAGAHRYQSRHDPRVGAPPSVDLDSTVERKNDHTSNFAEHRRSAIHELASQEGVTFRHETATFAPDSTNIDPESGSRVLDVADDRIAADYVVIATGSRVSLPDLPGFDSVSHWTSADVLDARSFPDTGVVMGFGYVGVELVPYLAEAGEMDLTVIEHDERPLDRAAPALGDEILAQYREEFGVEILTQTEERSIEPTSDGGVRLLVDDQAGRDRVVEAEALFAFTGREPDLRVGLEHTVLEPREGWVESTMRTSDDPRIFVVGDATGDRMLLHNAKEEGHLAAENIVSMVTDSGGLRRYEPIHHSVMFAGLGVYPYASIGMTANEASENGLDPIVATRAATDDGVFKTKDAARGCARLVVARDGTVLGYHGIHYHADVMAKTMQVILENNLTVDAIPNRAFHPTTPEILDGLLREAADRL